MQPALHIRLPVLTLSAFLCATAAPQVGAEGPAPFSSGPQPGVENNFGFPLAFDPSKMDTSADPRGRGDTQERRQDGGGKTDL